MPESKVKDALDAYKSHMDAWGEQFDRMREDQRFAAGEQWPEALRRMRENDPSGARPCLTLDRINQYRRQVLNDARQNRPSIKVRPVDNTGDVETAEAIQGVCRHIEDVSRADIAYDTAIEASWTGGIGWFRLVPETVDEARNIKELRIRRIPNCLSVISDGDWIEPDGLDITSLFVVQDYTKEAFKKAFPGADASGWERDADEWLSRDGVKVAEWLYIDEAVRNTLLLVDGREVLEEEFWRLRQAGDQTPYMGSRKSKTRKVRWVKLTRNEVLEETEFPGRHIPVIPVLGNEHWVDGRRELSGAVRWMRDASQMYNYGVSAVVEYIALQPKAPWIVAEGAIDGYEHQWDSANRANLPYLTHKTADDNGQPLPIPSRSAPPLGNSAWMQALQIFDDALQASTGMYKASLGAPSNEKSGKAIIARQREGDTATFHYIDNMRRSIRHAGQIIVDTMPVYYDTRRVVRILGEDGDSDTAVFDPSMTGQRYEGVFNPSVGTYDVSVSSGPGYSTRRQEAAEAMMEIASRNPAVWQTHGDLIAKSMDWPMAQDFAKRSQLVLPPQIQQAERAEESGQSPEVLALHQQMQGQMAQAAQAIQKLQAENAKLRQEAQAARADTAIKAEEVKIKGYEAETERMQAMAAAMSPEQVQAIVLQTLQQLMSPGIDSPQGAGVLPTGNVTAGVS